MGQREHMVRRVHPWVWSNHSKSKVVQYVNPKYKFHNKPFYICYNIVNWIASYLIFGGGEGGGGLLCVWRLLPLRYLPSVLLCSKVNLTMARLHFKHRLHTKIEHNNKNFGGCSLFCWLYFILDI